MPAGSPRFRASAIMSQTHRHGRFDFTVGLMIDGLAHR